MHKDHQHILNKFETDSYLKGSLNLIIIFNTGALLFSDMPKNVCATTVYDNALYSTKLEEANRHCLRNTFNRLLVDNWC